MPNASRKRKRERSRDLENFRRRPKTDRQRLMPSEPRELSKRARESPEKRKEKSLNTSRKS
jgi:hypothetical protein